MAQTTTSTLDTVVPAEFIAAQVLQEARPHNVVQPLVFNDILPQGQGAVYHKGKLPTTTADAVAEGSDITADARTTPAAAAITVGEVGLATELTQLAQETARAANTLMDWAASQGRAIAQKITADLCGLFAALNGGTPIGTSGSDITIDNFIEAIYTLDNNNAAGQKVAVLHPRQVADVFSAIVTAGGAVYHNLPELVREGRLPEGQPSAGFAGMLFGVPIYSTTEVDTANGGEDRAGAMFVRDAMGFIQLRPITAAYDLDASKRSVEIVVTAAYGVGEIEDTYGVPIVTDA